MFSITCAVDAAWRAARVSCSESQLVLAGNVGGEVWADRIAGPQLELEPVGATGLFAVRGSCPVTKDERSWKNGIISVMQVQYSLVHCWLESQSSFSTSFEMCTLVSRSFLQSPSEPPDAFCLVF